MGILWQDPDYFHPNSMLTDDLKTCDCSVVYAFGQSRWYALKQSLRFNVGTHYYPVNLDVVEELKYTTIVHLFHARVQNNNRRWPEYLYFTLPKGLFLSVNTGNKENKEEFLGNNREELRGTRSGIIRWGNRTEVLRASRKTGNRQPLEREGCGEDPPEWTRDLGGERLSGLKGRDLR